ncbi:MAG: MinD/ParA family protein [Selenomonadaceae bacterium]
MDDQAARLRSLVESRNVSNDMAPYEINYGLEPMESMTRIIAVTSGKGGVGKTNLTVNLAIAMGMAGKRVLIIDADLGMGNVDVILGTASKYSLMNLLQEDILLEDVMLQGPYGVNYISGGSGMEHIADFSITERERLMQKLYECEKLADIILVDTGAGLGKNVLDFIVAADEVVLLTTPEPTALTDAYAVMKAYSHYAVQKNMKLIVNRVYDESESQEVVSKLKRTSDKFLQMTIDFLGYIYEDRNMMNAVKQQIPLLVSYPNTVSAKCIRAIANSLLYGKKVRVKKGWRGFLQKFIDFSH